MEAICNKKNIQIYADMLRKLKRSKNQVKRKDTRKRYKNFRIRKKITEIKN